MSAGSLVGLQSELGSEYDEEGPFGEDHVRQDLSVDRLPRVAVGAASGEGALGVHADRAAAAAALVGVEPVSGSWGLHV